MTLKSLEDFDRENAAKRARLEKDHKLAHALPTNGVMVRWIGENGWDAKGAPKPPVEREIDVAPWIIHAPFRGCEHVAYRAPDSLAGDRGEHVSSQYRPAFVLKYFDALLDAFEPFMSDTVCLEGTYKSFQHESWDYASNKDYKDASETARGLYVVQVSTGKGYSSAKLEFHAYTVDTGPLQVSFDIEKTPLQWWKLAPRGESSGGERSEVKRWHWPDAVQLNALRVFRRADTERNCHGVPTGYTTEYLFESRRVMLEALGVGFCVLCDAQLPHGYAHKSCPKCVDAGKLL